MTLRHWTILLLLPWLAGPLGAQTKSRKDIPPPIEVTGETRRTDIFPLANGDRIVQYNNPDRKDKPTDNPVPSRIRMFIPGNVKTIRGIIYDLGFTYTSDNTALQAVAREEGWAIIGCLLRYKFGDVLLDMALKDFAQKTNHPELVACPIIPMGFSRNGRRAWDLAEEMPARTIALGLGGNPGIPVNFKNPDRITLAKNLPVLTVVGSRDPFVDYDKGEARFWHNNNYPQIRAQEGVTWGMMIGWGYGHDWEGSWAVFVPFLQDVFALRDTQPHQADGAAKFAPIPFEKGWLAEHGWKTPWPEIAPVADFKGDKTKAIWLPSAGVAHVWRAFAVQKPQVTLAVTAAQGQVTLEATAPANTTEVEFFDRAQSLGTIKAAPFILKTDALAKGVHTVFAVATTPGGKTPARPITLAGGQPLDWTAGAAVYKVAGAPENVARLSPELRKTLQAILTNTPPQPAAAEVTALRTALEGLQKDPFIEQRDAAGKLLKALANPTP